MSRSSVRAEPLIRIMMACLLSTLVCSTARPAPAFRPPSDFDVGNNPYTPVVADFDGDGRADIAVANFYAGSVSVLLGNGDGTFQPRQDYATDRDPNWLGVGDLNGDGSPDLVTANRGPGTVSVLLSMGSGRFAGHVEYPVGPTAYAGAIVDLNGDGRLDLVIPSNTGSALSVLLGNGDGTLVAAGQYSTATGPGAVFAADFDRDGHQDVAMACGDGSTISVRLGRGDGTLGPANDFPAGNTAADLGGAVDLNGDDIPDLVWRLCGGVVAVALGTGTGRFESRTDYAVGTSLGNIVVGDINGDGAFDLATIDWDASVASVLIGKGDGAFLPAQSFPTTPKPNVLGMGDVNGDGRPDLVIAVDQNYHSPVVSVLLNDTPQEAVAATDTATIEPGLQTGLSPESQAPAGTHLQANNGVLMTVLVGIAALLLGLLVGLGFSRKREAAPGPEGEQGTAGSPAGPARASAAWVWVVGILLILVAGVAFGVPAYHRVSQRAQAAQARQMQLRAQLESLNQIHPRTRREFDRYVSHVEAVQQGWQDVERQMPALPDWEIAAGTLLGIPDPLQSPEGRLCAELLLRHERCAEVAKAYEASGDQSPSGWRLVGRTAVLLLDPTTDIGDVDRYVRYVTSQQGQGDATALATSMQEANARLEERAREGATRAGPVLEDLRVNAREAGDRANEAVEGMSQRAWEEGSRRAGEFAQQTQEQMRQAQERAQVEAAQRAQQMQQAAQQQLEQARAEAARRAQEAQQQAQEQMQRAREEAERRAREMSDKLKSWFDK